MSKRSKNALTHGGYAQDVVLPWEDAQAFEKLYEDLCRDLKASNYLQREKVRQIAKEIVRKQRLAIAYVLPFYKKQMTPELMEAAKGGVAGIAAYLADPSNHSGVEFMSTEELLMRVKRGELKSKDEGSINAKEISNKNRITSDLVEQAYDLDTLEKHLKIETMIDNRIKSHLAGLVALKSYDEMYGEKSIEVLPPPEASPMNPANPPPPGLNIVMNESNHSANN